MIKKNIWLLVLAASLFTACHTNYSISRSVRTEYRVDDKKAVDSTLLKSYLPYKKRLDSTMNAVVGKSDVKLTKSYELPETLLGNFFADAVSTELKSRGIQADFFLPTTKGGLRNELPAGDIHLYNLFELMPFENEFVQVQLSGEDTERLLNGIAASGGQPVAGLKMVINKGAATSVMINGQLFDRNKTYTVISSDYIVNGGDHLPGLQNPLTTKALGIRIRDVIIDYVKAKTKAGQTISATLDGRITKN